MRGWEYAVPLALDLDVPETSPAQKALAVALLVLFFVVLTALAYRLQFTNLSDQQSKHKSTLQGQREDLDPRTFRVSRRNGYSGLASRVQAAVRGESDIEDVDRMTVREATDRVVSQWSEYFVGVPRYVTYGVLETAFVLLLGSMAVVNEETWRRYLSAKPDYPDPTVIIDIFTDAAATGHEVALKFPFASLLWDLLFAYSVLFIEWLYNHWYITAPALLIGTFVVFFLDYRSTELRESNLFSYDTTAYAKLAAVVIAVWTAGALPAEAGRLSGFSTAGKVLGLLAALVMLSYGLWLGYHGLRQRLSDISTMHEGGENLPDSPAARRMRRVLTVYLMTWKTWAFFAVLLVPILALYASFLLLSGKLLTLLGYLINESSLDVKVVVTALVLSVVVPFLYMARSEWGTLRAAASEAFARKRVRIALFARALPLGVMGLVYAMAFGFEFGFVTAVVAAVVAGIATVWGYRLFVRAKYRARMSETTTTVPDTALIQVYPPLTDANGEEKYFVRVNGEGLAHDTLEGEADIDPDVEVVSNIGEAVEVAVDDLFTDGEVKPSVATWHARNMFRFGIVDINDTTKKIMQKMRRDVFPRLEKKGGKMETTKLRRKIEDYPEDIREDKWAEWHVHGTKEGTLRQRGDYTVLMP